MQVRRQCDRAQTLAGQGEKLAALPENRQWRLLTADPHADFVELLGHEREIGQRGVRDGLLM